MPDRLSELPARHASDGVIIAVRVTPKSSKDEVRDVAERDGAQILNVRVRASPEDGKANKAVERLIAAWLDVPKSSVGLKSGGRSRYKQIYVEGNPATLLARIAELCG